MNNYIVDVNRFKLAGPPTWWLKKLWDFDPSLVVVPSRQDCIYRLAQRRPLKLPEHITNDALFNQSDTKMLASYNLVPVTTILSTANWSNPLMFEELRQRAPWRMGGAEKVIKDIEGAELEQEIKSNIAEDARLTEIARKGYRHWKNKYWQ